MMTSKLKPIEEPYAEDVAEILSQYPQQDGYILQLFRAFANSTRFLQKGVPNLLDSESPLTLRQRELIILRVTAKNRCEYEWGVHVAIFSKAAKLSTEQVNATCNDESEVSCWSAGDRLLLATVDQLIDSGSLTDGTKTQFNEAFSAEEQLEVVALCGAYQTVSYVANIADIPPEPFAVRFPN